MNKGHRIRMIIPSLIFIGFAALIVLPWSLRNSIVFGEVSISRGALGYHVWAGNNPHATGYSDQIDPANNPIAGKFPEKDGSFTGILSDPHQAAYLESHTSAYLGLAMSWIKDNPRDFVLLTLKRVKYFWYQIPRANISKGELLNTWILVVMEVLAMVGVFWSRDNIERTSLLMLFLLFFPVLFYLTHVVYYRHRFHVEPFLLIIASHGCICLWEKILRRFPIGLVARR